MPNLPSTTPTILEVLEHHEAELRARGMSADDARAKCELLTKKLGSRIRMLASAADAEVVSAARSAAELMKSFGADFHAVADQVERRANGASPTNGVATKADIKKSTTRATPPVFVTPKTNALAPATSLTRTACRRGTRSRSSANETSTESKSRASANLSTIWPARRCGANPPNGGRHGLRTSSCGWEAR
jgi:hypothetical protein